MTIDEAQKALHAAGWLTGDALVRTSRGHLWHVYALRKEETVVAKAESQADAWREAVRLAGRIQG